MTIKFPDLSHYKTGVDVSKYPALITKATEGTSFIDSTYSGYKAAAAKAQIPFAAYHFLAHGVDVTAQAKHAFAVIGHVPAMLDVETGTSGNPTLSEVVGFVKAYKALGGTMTLIYLPHWYWQGHWGSPSLQVLEDLGLALISSAYTSYSDTGIGWNSYGGVKPTIWQYTSTPMDMNAFKGTQDQLAAVFNGTTGSAGSVSVTGDDMLLTDKLSTGQTVDQALTTILARSANLGPWEKAELDALAAKVDTIAATVAALPTTAAPAAPLSDADVARIAAAVLDEQHRRDAS